jgi:hypothetical protein
VYPEANAPYVAFPFREKVKTLYGWKLGGLHCSRRTAPPGASSLNAKAQFNVLKPTVAFG